MDMEKVIKGFTVCSEHGLLNGEDCHGHYEYTDNLADIIKANNYSKQCPYNGCETGCVKTLAKDTLSMLKEQEEVRRNIVHWLGKFCAYLDFKDECWTYEENLAFFRKKMKEQFGWDVADDED